jgi:glycosyltransferase involved in cell wall biosynthesis
MADVPVPVAIDGRRLQERPFGGVGRWLANIVPHLAAQAEIVLLTDAGRPPAAFVLPGGGIVAEAPLWLPARAPEVVWIQTSVARWLRRFPGVFHGTFNQLPLAWRGPSVVTLHDLASRDHPEDFTASPGKRLVWNAQLRQAAHQAGAIQTDSEYIRQAVLAAYGGDADRVVVAAPSVDPLFHPDRAFAGHALASSLGVGGSYVVAVGGARRRGLAVAVEAWAAARRRGATEDLVVVGTEPVGTEPLAPRPGLVAAGRLPDNEWANLLAGAAALCYPTRYEGYGLPALEAAASGVPVVCARVGPLPEVLGDAAEWCADTSASAIGAGLTRLLGDPDRRARLRAAGLARVAAAPTAADAAEILLGTYRRVAVAR